MLCTGRDADNIGWVLCAQGFEPQMRYVPGTQTQDTSLGALYELVS